MALLKNEIDKARIENSPVQAHYIKCGGYKINYSNASLFSLYARIEQQG
jgi:hypothetical protein